MPIRLVTFDALYTLLEPRAPIAVQYAELFRPYLGLLDTAAIHTAFKSAYKLAQKATPSTSTPPEQFWAAVIRDTALGAGADPAALRASLPALVPALLHRFSSREGYALYDDTLPTLVKLRDMRVKTGLVSNADERILHALADLGAAKYLDPVVLSEREGAEKPGMALYQRAATRGGVSSFAEVLHVGDELENDYEGAWNARIPALLLRRSSGLATHQEDEADGEDLSFVDVVKSLDEVVDHVERRNDEEQPQTANRRRYAEWR